MKKNIRISAVIVALICFSFTRASLSILEPICPNNTEIFFFQPDSQLIANGNPIFKALNTPDNWAISVSDTDEMCSGVVRVCAICAPVADVNALILRPDLSGTDLQEKFRIYATTRNSHSDDQAQFLFFEKDGIGQ